jgi:hypothetical protein
MSLGAVDDVAEAFLVQSRQVARAHPAVDEGLGGGLRDCSSSPSPPAGPCTTVHRPRRSAARDRRASTDMIFRSVTGTAGPQLSGPVLVVFRRSCWSPWPRSRSCPSHCRDGDLGISSLIRCGPVQAPTARRHRPRSDQRRQVVVGAAGMLDDLPGDGRHAADLASSFSSWISCHGLPPASQLAASWTSLAPPNSDGFITAKAAGGVEERHRDQQSALLRQAPDRAGAGPRRGAGSCGPRRRRRRRCCCCTARCVASTPLGLPVVPEV